MNAPADPQTTPPPIRSATFAEYIDQQRPNVTLSRAQAAWVADVDRVLALDIGWGIMRSLLRDYLRFTR